MQVKFQAEVAREREESRQEEKTYLSAYTVARLLEPHVGIGSQRPTSAEVRNAARMRNLTYIQKGGSVSFESSLLVVANISM